MSQVDSICFSKLSFSIVKVAVILFADLLNWCYIWYAAIILVAIIYYYSPPMGTKTWMKALLYPSFSYCLFLLHFWAGNKDVWSPMKKFTEDH
jgi:hypothetical protein